MPDRQRVLRATLVLLAWLVPTGTVAFDCAPLKPSTTRTPAYQAVSGQARCEGFFERTVSQAFIELVSLTRGAMPAAPAASARGTLLELRADAPVPVRLVVQPQRSGPFYRMDAELPAGQALAWDPATMLGVTGLRLADLGFLALAASSPGAPTTPAALAPVVVSSEGAAQGPPGLRAQAMVRVSVAVSSMAWRSYRPGPEGSSIATWRDLPDSRLYAWQRLAVPIELPEDGKSLRVDVQAVGEEDGRALPLLRFTIVGRRDGSH